MVIFIVFVVVVAAIGLAVYGGSMVHDPITYIPDDGEEPCVNPSANVICTYCWGLIEQNCGCPKMPSARWCKCAEPQRSDILDDL